MSNYKINQQVQNQIHRNHLKNQIKFNQLKSAKTTLNIIEETSPAPSVRKDVYIEHLLINTGKRISTPVEEDDIAVKGTVDDIAFDVLNTAVANIDTETSVVINAWATFDYNLKDRIDTSTGAITIEDGESVAFNFAALLDNPNTALSGATSLVKAQLTSADGTTTIYTTRDVASGSSGGASNQPSISRNFGYTNTSGGQEVVYLTVRGENLGATLVINNHELTARWLKQ